MYLYTDIFGSEFNARFPSSQMQAKHLLGKKLIKKGDLKKLYILRLF